MYDEKTLERFWAKVNKESGYIAPNMTTECWEWTSALTVRGYGLFTLSKPQRQVYAHRLSYEIRYGEIQDGLLACHHCDNRKCIRPDHLFEGTPLENVQDMIAKGRGRRGARKHSAIDQIGLLKEFLDWGGTTKQFIVKKKIGFTTLQRAVGQHIISEKRQNKTAKKLQALADKYRVGNCSMQDVADSEGISLKLVFNAVKRFVSPEERELLNQQSQERAAQKLRRL